MMIMVMNGVLMESLNTQIKMGVKAWREVAMRTMKSELPTTLYIQSTRLPPILLLNQPNAPNQLS